MNSAIYSQLIFSTIDHMSADRWQCFYPLTGIFVGILLAVAAYLVLPSGWEESWQVDWIPRFLALMTTVVFWCMFTAWRGYKLHCGGTEVASTPVERNRSAAVCAIIFFLMLGSLYGYIIGSEATFFAFCIVALVIALSEVGWGDPLKMVRGAWK